jgi:cation diffusion facilitator CzcD-associated flavoprotein CzcO
LTTADWSSDEQQWNIDVETDAGAKRLSARFVIFSTGYYDYHKPLEASIPGIEDFKGQTIHPQFWPEDLDYSGKKIVIIGSGATAVTIFPILAEKAEMVTILQRSPTYILTQPAVDPFAQIVRKILPSWLAFKLVRWKFLIIPFLFYQFCRAYPNAGRWIIKRRAKKQLPEHISHDPNFQPRYNPWEQRLCVCPDGDFYKALHGGHADIVTDKIKTVTATGIQTESGKTLDADIIVTATGLKMQILGGIKVSTDGKPISVSDKFVWKGQMLQDVPNAVIVVGYVNASWTLGSDSTAISVTRLLKHMDQHGMASATPRIPEDSKMKATPIINLNSTYVEKAKSVLPSAGNVGPWKPRVNYIMELWEASHGSVTDDIEFAKADKKDI